MDDIVRQPPDMDHNYCIYRLAHSILYLEQCKCTTTLEAWLRQHNMLRVSITDPQPRYQSAETASDRRRGLGMTANTDIHG